MSCANIKDQHGGKPDRSRMAALQNAILDHITAYAGSRIAIFVTTVMLAHDISRQKLTLSRPIADDSGHTEQRNGDEKTTQHAG
ncbi:hypothetical protein CRSA0334_15390 [Cronobacter malonaticus ENBT0334]|nr:hypothetical protein AFK66_022655 [Cronobacter malonaticus LMG 23826]KIU61375.1 hypothetical protein CRSA0334_15390 [Cronobacter malonaticus ENBT0334]